jgi:hypothetical protein
LGIDPGKRGAVAVITDEGILATAREMPNQMAFVSLMKGLSARYRVSVTIEKAQVMGKGEGSVGMFNYGRHYGTMIGVMDALGIHYREVPPAEWTRAMHAEMHGETAKEKSRAFVETEGTVDRFIPEGCRVPHDGLVDAYLIGLYGFSLSPGAESTCN